MSKHLFSNRYMIAVILAGLVCVAIAGLDLDPRRFDAYLALLAIFTVAIGSRVTIQIPRFKSHISVSDTFIFLVLLLYGGEYAVILAAIEAGASAWRFCNRKITVFFNAGAMALSTSFVVVVLKFFGFYSDGQMHGTPGYEKNFVVALSLIAVTQFMVNTTLASFHDFRKGTASLLSIWKDNYAWSFFSYFIGAAGAGLMVQASDAFGLSVLLATLPVIFFVFLSYRMYLKNIEISMQQAEQAEGYAKILETQSDALRESETRFRSAFDHAPIGIALVSPTGDWLKANRALIEILGYSEDELLATNFQSVTLPEDLDLCLEKIDQLVAGEITTAQMEQRYVHKTGRTVWTSWSVSAAGDSKSEHRNLIFQIQDITSKKNVEERLQHEATHDALTGLPNRPVFMKRLGEALQKNHNEPGYGVSVLFIDLDRFKYVNDSLGHLIGDELLKEIAHRLRDCLRPSDLVVWLGGDEFTILVEGHSDLTEVTNIADRIQHKFSIAFDLDGHEVYSSASIGILHASDQHLTSEDVMRDADTAMYQAKRAGKARHEVFDEKMHRAATEILRLETDLRRAVERDEIKVFYQPIYNLKTNEIECFESLARWEHPEFGWISPTKFIPLAEEIGLIDRVCAHVLRTACTDIGSLAVSRSDRRKYSISVNLSCRQFSQNTLTQDIRGILNETSFSPHNLKLEITESVFFEHQNRAIVMLNQLRDSGIEINVDDFGTGYSNLGYLKMLPITALKIDRSFVSMISAAGDNDEIVRAIITLARNLGLTVIAEGIESLAHLERLQMLGCEGGQGFLFAAPMNFDDLRVFLSKDDSRVYPPLRLDDVPAVSMLQ